MGRFISELVEAVPCQIKQTVATLSRKLIFLASAKLHSEPEIGQEFVESIENRRRIDTDRNGRKE